MLYYGCGLTNAKWNGIISLDLVAVLLRLPHVQLAGHHDPQSLLSWAAPRTGCAGAGVTPDRESWDAPTLKELLKW